MYRYRYGYETGFDLWCCDVICFVPLYWSGEHLGAMNVVLTSNYRETNSAPSLAFQPWGIDTTTTGIVLVTCTNTQSVYAIQPDTGVMERVAGYDSLRDRATGEATATERSEGRPSCEVPFRLAQNLVVVDRRHAMMVCDTQSSTIRCVTLPPHLWNHNQNQNH